MTNPLAACLTCDDNGWVVVEGVKWVCCGNYLDTGECCSAKYGEDRLVPEPIQEQATCPDCEGGHR